MAEAAARPLATGLSQKGVRNHNERLLLSLLQRQGAMPGSDLARLSGLSAPTVSTILRRLEAEGFLQRGTPQRGKIGKPSVPMALAPEGALAWGLKIGRRTSELLLLDLTGGICAQRNLTYDRPLPDAVFDFVSTSIARISRHLRPEQIGRVCGFGAAAPFELWHPAAQQKDRSELFAPWLELDLAAELEARTALPVSVTNDATAACHAEHVYGRGKELRDYAYFYVGAYIGGGVVLNDSVYEGRKGNAGALGSMRTVGAHGESRQLIDTASIHLLEKRLEAADLDPARLYDQPQDWSAYARHTDPWLRGIAQEVARAAMSTCAVIDFEAVLIDGAFPPDIRADLTARVQRYMANQDTRGLIPPRVEEASIGSNARAIGAAGRPIFAQYFLDRNAERSAA